MIARLRYEAIGGQTRAEIVVRAGSDFSKRNSRAWLRTVPGDGIPGG